jgi:hypothetical protein
MHAAFARDATVVAEGLPGPAATENFPVPGPEPATGPIYQPPGGSPPGGRGPQRPAHRSPGRAADRPAHPHGTAMTTAGLHRPARENVPPPAAGTRPQRGCRMAVSRPVPMAVTLLAGLGALLWAALHWHWNIPGGAAAQQLIPLTIQAGAAALIAVTTHGPFAEPERAAGWWLPWLRLGAAAASTTVTFGALAAGAAAGGMPGGTLALLHNLGGIAGIGLLSAAVLGGAFGWTGPMAYLLITEGALAHRSTTP